MMGVSKCALAVAFCLTLSGFAALAQEPQAPPATPPSGPPPTTLSLVDAVQMSLKNNLDARVARYTPLQREQDILFEESAFDPNVGAFFQYTDQTRQSAFAIDVQRTAFDPNVGITPVGDFSLLVLEGTDKLMGGGFSDRVKWGGEYSAGLTLERVTSTSANVLLPTYYAASLRFNYNQSLLRGWGTDVNTTRITVARTNLDISRSVYRGDVLDVLRRTEDAYWELVFARQDLEVNNESLRLAQELLKLNRIKVQVGTLPPIEITTAEAEVANREQGVIVAENAVRDAEDTLRAVMNMPKTDEMWTRPIAPSDMPTYVEHPVDLAGSLEQAMRERPELQQAKMQIDNADVQLRFDKKQLKWDLRAFGNYELTGLSGDIPRDVLFGNSLIPAQNQDFSEALEFIWDPEFATWTVGANLSIPIGNNGAEAAYVRSRLGKDQAEANYENLKLRAEVDVRTATRAIDTNHKRIQAAEKNVELQKKKVEAEQKKFENGMSTSFQVLEFQEDLTTALGQLNRALVDYRKSLTALERAKGTLDDYLDVEVQ
jgi:outer membrane protein